MDAVSQARKAALKALGQARRRQVYVRDFVRSSELIAALESAQDRSFASALVIGTYSFSYAMPEVYGAYSKRPLKLTPQLQDLLNMATFELLHMQSPAYAVIHDAVELAKRVQPKAAGLVNALLRRVAERDMVRYRSYAEHVSTLSDSDLANYLHVSPSVVEELFASDPSSIRRELLVRSFEAAPTCAYLSHRLSETQQKELSSKLGGELLAPHLIAVGKPDVLARTAELTTGDVIPCDFAAYTVAAQVIEAASVIYQKTQRPVQLLEIGQGRATKTLLMLNGAAEKNIPLEIVSLELQASKVALATKRIKRAGFEHAQSFAHDGRDLSFLQNHTPFDLIFIDAPCSGTGTLRRHPELFSRIHEKLELDELHAIQAEMLKSACELISLHTSGEIIYSTCSVLDSENREQIARVLAAHPELELKEASYICRALQKTVSDTHFIAHLA